jgi:AMP deaminase
MATPTTARQSKMEENPYPPQRQPVSPTSSTRTNASSTAAGHDLGQPSYQQFPAQAARIPTSLSQVQLDQQGFGSPIQPPTTRDHTRQNSSVASPRLAGLGGRETSWPVEGFTALHISGSEPRIFPGVVSRTQRRDSLVRQSSMSETDDHGSAGTSRKGGNRTSMLVDGAVEETVEETVEEAEKSDGEMEEAGGSDE